MATALIVIPIALSAAAEMDVSAQPVLMAVTVSAAAAFLTPVATPANLMVMGPGGYRFGDYWKLGLPLLRAVRRRRRPARPGLLVVLSRRGPAVHRAQICAKWTIVAAPMSATQTHSWHEWMSCWRDGHLTRAGPYTSCAPCLPASPQAKAHRVAARLKVTAGARDRWLVPGRVG